MYLVAQGDCSVVSFDAHLTKVVGTPVAIKWHVLGQTAASRCEGLPFYFHQATSNTLKVGTESVPEKSENLHILMPSARENLTEFCRHETFKNAINYG
jgi:hypothetical protein